jgi:hypothetical protein
MQDVKKEHGNLFLNLKILSKSVPDALYKHLKPHIPFTILTTQNNAPQKQHKKKNL